MKSKDECALLTHTSMKLDEIARDTGFEYDTYFIKQFQADKRAGYISISNSEIVDVNVNLSCKSMFDKVHKITNQIPELYPSMHMYSSRLVYC